MSHELRTPLNAVIGFSELLMDEGRGHPHPRAGALGAGHPGRRPSTLLSLINDILDLAEDRGGARAITLEALSPETRSATRSTLISPAARRNEILVRSSSERSGARRPTAARCVRSC
jgi:signal transduction histidine kinase